MNPFVNALDEVHDVNSFDCGTDTLNIWLRQVAKQHQKNYISQTFVLESEDDSSKVLGFYALALRGMTPTEDLPEKMAKKLPKGLPGITLARLAVHEDEQGKKFGELLLVDAMKRAFSASQSIGGWALFVDAKDAKASEFYKKYGFVALPSNPLVLFMPFKNMPT